DPNLLFGTGIGDDAGVYRLSDEIAIVQTVDFFTPIVDDPYDFGVIAAANALSDCFTLGARPTTALNIVAFPCKIGLDVLKEILRGGADAVAEAGASIVGGHSVQDDEPKYGIAVTGIIHPDKVVRNDGAQPGDLIVINKKIGTGIASNLNKQNNPALSSEIYAEVTASMKQLHTGVLPLFEEFKINATTDITGFGLLGHAQTIAAASGVSLSINSSVVPTFAGVLEKAAEAGGGGAARNMNYIESMMDRQASVDDNHYTLLHDAQTSGPIMFSIAADKADSLVESLKQSGFPSSEIIGEVKSGNAGRVVIT
ncbi:UNVERIFIED_CONTAM: hypothetical protein GTU68_006369, partial [Idotea baltica]|nr:hypothetical protein [Idotea baltica]